MGNNAQYTSKQIILAFAFAGLFVFGLGFCLRLRPGSFVCMFTVVALLPILGEWLMKWWNSFLRRRRKSQAPQEGNYFFYTSSPEYRLFKRNCWLCGVLFVISLFCTMFRESLLVSWPENTWPYYDKELAESVKRTVQLLNIVAVPLLTISTAFLVNALFHREATVQARKRKDEQVFAALWELSYPIHTAALFTYAVKEVNCGLRSDTFAIERHCMRPKGRQCKASDCWEQDCPLHEDFSTAVDEIYKDVEHVTSQVAPLHDSLNIVLKDILRALALTKDLTYPGVVFNTFLKTTRFIPYTLLNYYQYDSIFVERFQRQVRGHLARIINRKLPVVFDLESRRMPTLEDLLEFIPLEIEGASSR